MSARATIFDAVRQSVPNVWNDAGNIVAMDNLLDALGVPADNDRREINADGLAIIMEFEGLRLQAYPDPATGGDPWTIGYGHTGADVRPGLVISQTQAEDLLRSDVRRFEDAVFKLVGYHATDNQFSALVSFAYNLGAEALKRSTLLRVHNEGNYERAANEFVKWNKAAGKVMRGLTRRREAEAALYRS